MEMPSHRGRAQAVGSKLVLRDTPSAELLVSQAGGPSARPRRSRDELRQLLLSTGERVLREEGLASLTFRRVFGRLEKDTGIRLTNGSVIGRVWENQADFRADVLVAVALGQNKDEVDRTFAAVGPALARIDLTTEESREDALRELCRLGGAANLQVMRDAGNWPLWIGAWGLIVSNEQHEHRERIEAALVAGHDAFNERIEEVYVAMMSLLGYRLRRPLTLRQFTTAADSLGQGCGLRDLVDGRNMAGILLPTGPRGQDQEWTLFAIGFHGLVKQFFELDPDWQRPPTDPSG